MCTVVRITIAVVLFCVLNTAPANAELRVGVFDIDASPPIGSPLAYDPTKEITSPLSFRGIVIAGSGQPIVLCAVDWIGIANEGQDQFICRIAAAVKTSRNRVVVHTLHQHDAPRCDFSVDDLLAEVGLSGTGFDRRFALDVARNAAVAAKKALDEALPVTHMGLGAGIIEKVASNRRILGPDGKVIHVRYTATRDPKVRAFPAGTIDPELKMLSLWSNEKPIVALSWYATHPQSYYRTGGANPDFPGIARNMRQTSTGVPHVHFNGAGGNIGAGKWNDGSHENRQILADRVAAGMKKAWNSTKKTPVSAEDVAWSFEPVVLPAAPHLDEKTLLAALKDEKATPAARWAAASNLHWLYRCQEKDTINIACLSIGKARVLHMPGELFVEYQLAAQKLRPDLFVAMAAYGDYGPGYIGTETAYGQGGYETSPRASRVAPSVETTLMDAVKKLLKK
jgi:hypothetical protein